MSSDTPTSRLSQWINSIEETFIVILMGLMVVVTFVNVVLRYGFNISLIWGLEVVLMLFAWLVLFGISYAFKITSHLGVDAVTNLLPDLGKRIMALISAVACIAYALLLLKGSWDYWAPFAELQPTTGHWLPDMFNIFADSHGFFTTGVRGQGWYETDQIPIPGMFRWLEDLINFGEEYEKMPRMVPYIMLPFASALILFRIIQATIRIIKGTQDSLIVSHEAEDAIEDAAAAATLKEG